MSRGIYPTQGEFDYNWTILKVPDPNGNFNVIMDASGEGLGGTLDVVWESHCL